MAKSLRKIYNISLIGIIIKDKFSGITKETARKERSFMIHF